MNLLTPMRSPYTLLTVFLILLFSIAACSDGEDENPKVEQNKEGVCQLDNDCKDPAKPKCTVGADNKAICQPLPIPPIPTTLDDGEACTEDAQCTGGTCKREYSWTGGYCTKISCTASSQCSSYHGPKNACFKPPQSSESLCIRLCKGNDTCRKGYECSPLNHAISACLPIPDVRLKQSCKQYTQDDIIYPYGITDEELKKSLPRELSNYSPILINIPTSAETNSYQISLFPDNPTNVIVPIGLFTDKDPLWILNSLEFTGSLGIYQTVNFMMPPRPDLQSYVSMNGDSSVYALVNTLPMEICRTIIEKKNSAASNTLDLNLYLTGVRDAEGNDLTPETAPHDEGLQLTLAHVRHIYGQVGITLGTIRYNTLNEEQIKRYRLIRNADGDTMNQLVALSETPGDSLDEKLSINVFLIEEFVGTGVLGMSMGLPGLAGFHGRAGTGVVFGTKEMHTSSDKRAALAQVMAHEMGHFLGLRHIAEIDGRYTQDGLPDTPECQITKDLQFGRECGTGKAFENLMFPLSIPETFKQETISPMQATIMKNNPLVKYNPDTVIEETP